MNKIIGICISEKRGTPKKNVQTGHFIENFGIEKDAHAGDWHRQVSLLSYKAFMEFKNKGVDIEIGAFGENLLVDDIAFNQLPIGSRLYCADVILEITQIGKKCHNHCQIYHQVGDCIMPREGVFAKVIHGGTLSVGDDMVLGEEVHEL